MEDKRDAQRYRGKPLLILIENLVLHSIRQLDEEQYRRLAALEPKLHRTFNRQGSWVDIVKAVLHMPQDIEDSIRRTWRAERETLLGGRPAGRPRGLRPRLC